MRRHVLGAALVLALSAGGARADEPLDAQLLSLDGFPATMNPGDTARVHVAVQNTGHMWYAPYVLLGASGSAPSFLRGADNVPFPPTEIVPRGGSRTFDFDILAPAAGSYDLVFQMRCDDVHSAGVFGAAATKHIDVGGGSPAPPSPPPPVAAGGTDGSSLVSIALPQAMRPGEAGTWSVAMTNSGTSVWDERFRLGVEGDFAGDGCRFIETTGAEPNRVHLPAGTTVPPGASWTFSFPVIAPSAPRDYAIRFRMVHELIQWFGETAVQTVTVTPGGSPPPPPPPPPTPAAVLEDPLHGSTIGRQSGGTLLATGYRIDNPDDHVTYEIPTLSDGVAEFSATKLVPGLPAGAVDDEEMFIMYDGAFSPDPEAGYIGFRNNTSKFLVRKRGDDVVKIAYVCGGQSNEATSGKLSWDPGHTYRFRVEWGGGSARVYLDGNLVVSAAGGTWAPAVHRLRVGDGGASRGWPGTVISDLVVSRPGSSAPPAPTTPTPAGQGPLVVRDVSAGSRLATSDGRPFFWVGKTAFGLQAQPRAHEFVDEAAANGVNVLRVLVAAAPGAFNMPQNMFPFVPGGYDQALFGRLDDVVTYAGTKGIACELVLFECGMLGNLANPTSYDGEKQRYVGFVVDRYKNTPNVIWEVANEYDHGSCGPNPYNGLPPSFVQAVAADVKRRDGMHLVGNSGQGGTDPLGVASTPDFDLLNEHLPRDPDFWKRPWDVFRASLGSSGGRVFVNDEPYGSDVVPQPGKRSNDPAAHRADAWVTAVAQGYFTFHCELGLTATPGAQPGQECLKAFHDFFDGVDMRGMQATTDFVRSSGAAETYGCRRGDDELVVYLEGGDLSRPVALHLGGASYAVTVVDPATGKALSSPSPIAGGDVLVGLSGAQGDVAVHLVRH